MKLPISILLLSLLSLQVMAQRVRMTDTTNQWEYIRHYEDAGDGHKFKNQWISFAANDTLVQKNGFEYCKIWGTLVREDTQAHKVYIWDDINNAEVLIHDYTLILGDTFRLTRANKVDTYVVIKDDTLFINGVSSKSLHLVPIPFDPISNYNIKIVEGVGSLSGSPVNIWANYPATNGIPELTCFRNKGIVPAGLGMSDSSCKANKALNITNTPAGKIPPGVYPQPAGQSVNIVLPESIDKGHIAVYNIEGRCVFSTTITNTQRIKIDNTQNWSGLYFYRVTGTAAYTGKIVF